MANYPTWVAEIGLRDGVNRNSTVSFRIPEATAKTYMAAADKTARDATAVGLLLTAVKTLTLMSETYRRVYVQDLTKPIGAIADTILRGNKFTLGYESGAGQFSFTIPGRDPSCYVQNADELSLDIAATSALADFITLFESTCLGPSGLSVSANLGYIND